MVACALPQRRPGFPVKITFRRTGTDHRTSPIHDDLWIELTSVVGAPMKRDARHSCLIFHPIAERTFVQFLNRFEPPPRRRLLFKCCGYSRVPFRRVKYSLNEISLRLFPRKLTELPDSFTVKKYYFVSLTNRRLFNFGEILQRRVRKARIVQFVWNYFSVSRNTSSVLFFGS